MQRRRKSFLIGLTAVLFLFAIVVSRLIVICPADAPGRFVLSAAFCLLALIVAAPAAFGPDGAMNDEGMRALQLRTTKWSYVTIMALLPMALLIVQLRPDWAAPTAVWATLVAAATPTVLLIALDRDPHADDTP